MDSAQKAKHIVSNIGFMVIASADAAGKPWVSPVGFTYDDDYNLYWVSNKKALHSTNIAARPEVGIVVYGQMPEGDTDGVYFDAKAHELTDAAEIQQVIDLFKARRPQATKFTTRSAQDVTGTAVWRMYKAVPVAVWKRAEDTTGGQAITVRERVQL